MTWVRLDDQFADHPKIDRLSDAAFRLHVAGLCYCGRYRTNGEIPMARVVRLVASYRPRLLAELITGGVWHQRGHDCPACPDAQPDGIYVHDFLEMNPTKEQLEEERVAGAERQRRSRLSRSSSHRDSNGASRVTEAVTDGGASPDPTRPITKPSRSDKLSPPPREDVERLCSLLVTLIADNGCEPPKANQAWRDAARLLIDRKANPVPLKEIEAVMRWALADTFWKSNVMSMPTFRKQFDRLRLKRAGEVELRNGNGDVPVRLDHFGHEVSS